MDAEWLTYRRRPNVLGQTLRLCGKGRFAAAGLELSATTSAPASKSPKAAPESARAGDESAKTTPATAAFQSLAQRLEAIAAQRAIKPWWQRLLRRAG